MSTSGCHDRLTDDASGSRHDVEHTIWQADLVRGIGEHERAQRRQLRGLQDQRASCGKTRSDLADDLMQRIIPRRHATDHADRLFDDERITQLLFEVGVANELRVHADHHDREFSLDLGRKADRRADFMSDRFRNLRHARFHGGR
jgi:hypothetical protein